MTAPAPALEPVVERAAHGTIPAEQLRQVPTPAFARLAIAVEERNANASGATNYSRMHHRHNRN